MPWIRQQVRWMDLHDKSGAIYWGELDDIIADASSMGVKILVSVVAAPSWATSNGKNGMPDREHFKDYNYFMGEMAKRYKGRIQAYEIWNEQNLAHENAGRVANPTFYMDMLVGASQAIKANDSSAIIVSGAPSSTETNSWSVAISDITYLDSMFSDARFNGAVDVVGVHPGGASNPPDTFWPDNHAAQGCQQENVGHRVWLGYQEQHPRLRVRQRHYPRHAGELPRPCLPDGTHQLRRMDGWHVCLAVELCCAVEGQGQRAARTGIVRCHQRRL